MLLTVRSKYAVTVVADVARHSRRGQPVSMRDVCQRQSIPVKYMEHICSDLVRAGLMKSFKGPGGGYCLCRDPSNMSVMQIVDAVGESVKMTSCSGGIDTCNDAGRKCIVHGLLSGLGKCICDYLGSVTVSDLAGQACSDTAAARLDDAGCL